MGKAFPSLLQDACLDNDGQHHDQDAEGKGCLEGKPVGQNAAHKGTHQHARSKEEFMIAGLSTSIGLAVLTIKQAGVIGHCNTDAK